MVNLTHELNKVMKKYEGLFDEMELQIHTADCHSDCIHLTFWVKKEDKPIDIFPKIFCYEIATETGRWEEPEFDPDYDETYEDGYIEEVSESELYLRMLNDKTATYLKKW